MGWNMFLWKNEPREIISLCRTKCVCVGGGGGGLYQKVGVNNYIKQFGLRGIMMLQKLKFTISQIALKYF